VQKVLHFSFSPDHTLQKVRNIRAKMDNFSAKQVRFHRKVVLFFFRSLGISQFASLSEEKKVREKGEERQHEENKKSGFIERSTAVSNANHFFCYLNKAHPIIYL
jgi:hypothetical protein